MGTTIDAVLEQALTLSDPERAELVERLIYSFTPERYAQVEAAWAAEADRRLKAYGEGKIQSFSPAELDLDVPVLDAAQQARIDAEWALEIEWRERDVEVRRVHMADGDEVMRRLRAGARL